MKYGKIIFPILVLSLLVSCNGKSPEDSTLESSNSATNTSGEPYSSNCSSSFSNSSSSNINQPIVIPDGEEYAPFEYCFDNVKNYYCENSVVDITSFKLVYGKTSYTILKSMIVGAPSTNLPGRSEFVVKHNNYYFKGYINVLSTKEYARAQINDGLSKVSASGVTKFTFDMSLSADARYLEDTSSLNVSAFVDLISSEPRLEGYSVYEYDNAYAFRKTFNSVNEMYHESMYAFGLDKPYFMDYYVSGTQYKIGPAANIELEGEPVHISFSDLGKIVCINNELIEGNKDCIILNYSILNPFVQTLLETIIDATKSIKVDNIVSTLQDTIANFDIKDFFDFTKENFAKELFEKFKNIGIYYFINELIFPNANTYYATSLLDMILDFFEVSYFPAYDDINYKFTKSLKMARSLDLSQDDLFNLIVDVNSELQNCEGNATKLGLLNVISDRIQNLADYRLSDLIIDISGFVFATKNVAHVVYSLDDVPQEYRNKCNHYSGYDYETSTFIDEYLYFEYIDNVTEAKPYIDEYYESAASIVNVFEKYDYSQFDFWTMFDAVWASYLRFDEANYNLKEFCNSNGCKVNYVLPYYLSYISDLKNMASFNEDSETIINNLLDPYKSYIPDYNDIKELLIDVLDLAKKAVDKNDATLDQDVRNIYNKFKDFITAYIDEYKNGTFTLFEDIFNNILPESNTPSYMSDLREKLLNFVKYCETFASQEFNYKTLVSHFMHIGVSVGKMMIENCTSIPSYIPKLLTYLDYFCDLDIGVYNCIKNMVYGERNAIVEFLCPLFQRIFFTDGSELANSEIKTLVKNYIVAFHDDDLNIADLMADLFRYEKAYTSNDKKPLLLAATAGLAFLLRDVQEIDYNELFSFIDLPEEVVSIDYNKLIENITNGEFTKEILDIHDVEVKYVLNDDGDIDAEIITFLGTMEINLLLASINANIQFSFRISY